MSRQPPREPLLRERFFRALARIPLAGSRVVVLVCLALTVLAAALLPRLEIEPDLSRLLPPGHEHSQVEALLDRRAAKSRTLLVVVRGERVAERLPEVAASLRGVTGVAGVRATRAELFESTAAEEAPLWFLPASKLEELARRLTVDRGSALAAARDQLAEDPIGGRELVLRDPLGLRWILADAAPARLPFRLEESTDSLVLAGGETGFLLLTGARSAFDAEFATALLEAIEVELAAFAPALRAELVGGYEIARNDAARLKSDLRGSTLVSALLVVIFLAFSMRSLRRALLVFVPVVLAAFWTLPIGSALFGPLSPVAVAAAAVLFGLGVDFTIHYLVHYARARQDGTHDSATLYAHVRSGPPISLGMLTTAGAFLSLAFGSFGGLRAFGCLLALGLLLVFAATLFVLPLLLRRAAPFAVFARSTLVRTIDKAATGTIGTLCASGMSVAALLALATILFGGVRLDADPEAMRPAGETFSRRVAKVEKELGFSTVPVALLFESTDRDSVAATVQRGLEQGHLAMVDGWMQHAVTAERRAAVATFRRRVAGWRRDIVADLVATGFAAAPFAPALDELARLIAAPEPARDPLPVVTDGERERRVVVAYPPAYITARSQLEGLASHLAPGGGTVEVFGTPTLVDELRRTLASDLTQAVWITAVLAVVLVSLAVGSLLAGLLALVPCCVGVGITIAILEISGIPLDLTNFIALPLLVGIGVDDGIHLTLHLRRGTSRTGETGVAVLRTSVTTMLAFGSLVTVSSPGLAAMGGIVTLGVGLCLVASLCVLPVVWRRLRPPS